jgi:hypothetical protein
LEVNELSRLNQQKSLEISIRSQITKPEDKATEFVKHKASQP